MPAAAANDIVRLLALGSTALSSSVRSGENDVRTRCGDERSAAARSDDELSESERSDDERERKRRWRRSSSACTASVLPSSALGKRIGLSSGLRLAL